MATMVNMSKHGEHGSNAEAYPSGGDLSGSKPYVADLARDKACDVWQTITATARWKGRAVAR